MTENITNWVAVASAEHVRIGRAQGFMQVNHGKLAPLHRIHAGDCVVYYSPSEVIRKSDGLQSFTAIGVVRANEPYQVSIPDEKFHPFRRDVDWQIATKVPIRPLLEHLEFTREKQNWGYQMRFGLFKISRNDRDLIAGAMKAQPNKNAP